MKYDNCKNCVSGCEHAGKDREFVCPKGKSCKVTLTAKATLTAFDEFLKELAVISNAAENDNELLNIQKIQFRIGQESRL